MNIKLIRAFIGVSILLVSGHASAIPVLMQYIVTFSNSGSSLAAGLTIDARTTDAPRLVVAGGYTIRCGSSSLEIVAENHSTLTGFTASRIAITVPVVSPAGYPVLGWSSIPAASCTQCAMQHKYQVRDETTTTASIGIAGTGVNFTLVPTGEIGATDTAVLSNVCKGGTPQCCTPGCSLP
jgi:hypothetical protein